MSVMKIFIGTYLLVPLFLLIVFPSKIDAQTCTKNGGIRGQAPPPGVCNTENDSECCVQDRFYPTYTCSPSMTQAKLTLNSFEGGGDGGGESNCNGIFYPNDERVVALSTGWYEGGARCNHEIIINGNGQSVKAIVVDQCDSTKGCDKEHSYQPPCPNNIVDASRAVWEALGVSPDNQGDLDITWTDA